MTVAKKSDVVDFEQFRRTREKGRLPLFDDTLRSLEPPRSLTERELHHRERMLKFLKDNQALGTGR